MADYPTNSDAAVLALESLLATQGMGVVLHGTDPNVARPDTFGAFLWIGSADPVNSDDEKDLVVKV